MIIIYNISCCNTRLFIHKPFYEIYYENIQKRFKIIILCCYKVNRKTGVQVSRDKKPII